MLSKRAFENWYFEFCEAEREFLEAKKIFELKRRDICLFLFKTYAEWSRIRFGEVLRPGQSATAGVLEKAVDLFFTEFGINSCFQDVVTRLLNQAFDERFGSVIERERALGSHK